MPVPVPSTLPGCGHPVANANVKNAKILKNNRETNLILPVVFMTGVPVTAEVMFST
jgi:hypothetical protein